MKKILNKNVMSFQNHLSTGICDFIFEKNQESEIKNTDICEFKFVTRKIDFKDNYILTDINRNISNLVFVVNESDFSEDFEFKLTILKEQCDPIHLSICKNYLNCLFYENKINQIGYHNNKFYINVFNGILDCRTNFGFEIQIETNININYCLIE